MKLSPEPNWEEAKQYGIGINGLELRGMLRTLTAHYESGRTGVTTVTDQYGQPLGSFTPEWFLSLPRRDQLRFLSVAKRMHNMAALERKKTNECG